jgi:hypothetical protein
VFNIFNVPEEAGRVRKRRLNRFKLKKSAPTPFPTTLNKLKTLNNSKIGL